ncbi:MAG: efflux transporter outer membrane subunit [Nitrospira sp.]|nr:efflux transporter outer membrane subunit [Nitrospira sp.]
MRDPWRGGTVEDGHSVEDSVIPAYAGIQGVETMMIWLLLSAMCLSVFGGCALGPDYARPPVESADGFRMQQGPDSGASSLADLAWWELFQDPHLQALIRQALLHNRDLKLAASRVREFRARLHVTGAGQFPAIEGRTSLQRSQSSLAAARQFGVPDGGDQEGPTVSLYQASADLSFEIDLWGKLHRATEAARADLLARAWARRTVVLTLISDVAQAYFNLQELDAERAIATRTLKTRQESLDIMRLRTLMGQSSTLDLRRAEREVARAQAVLPDLDRRIGQTEHHLSLLVGQPPAAIVRGATLRQSPLVPEVPAGLPSALLERRPDIVEAEQQLAAAQARIGVAKAALFPAISLTGNFGAQSLVFSDLFIGPARIWSLGPAITVPLFNAGRHRANLEVSHAQQEQALLTYERTIHQAFREVEDALIACHTSRETYATRSRLAGLSRDALQLAQLAYLNGNASYLDILTAQREVFDADITLAQTQRDRLVTVVQLYKALGGGWHQPNAPAPGSRPRLPLPQKPLGEGRGEGMAIQDQTVNGANLPLPLGEGRGEGSGDQTSVDQGDDPARQAAMRETSP